MMLMASLASSISAESGQQQMINRHLVRVRPVLTVGVQTEAKWHSARHTCVAAYSRKTLDGGYALQRICILACS